MLAPQLQRWSLRQVLDLDSEKFRCFNYRDELESTAFKLQIGRGIAWLHACMHGAWYVLHIAQG